MPFLIRFTLLVFCVTAAVGAAPADIEFTEAQVTAGKAAYEIQCASCHGGSLRGSHVAPALNGQRFDQNWRGKPARVLAYHVRRMPPESTLDSDGQPLPAMTESDYTNVLAYLLQSNGLDVGETPLPDEMAKLAALDIPKLPGQDLDPDTPVELSRRQKIRLSGLTDVTDEMLSDPAPGEWLHWGRTYDGGNHSPLTAVDSENVDELTTAWRRPLRGGTSMAMPIVHEGVLFLHTFPDTVLAIDATNGDVLWRYQYEFKGLSSQKMGLAIGGNKIFVPTSNLHVLALDMRTGELLWDHEIELESKSAAMVPHQLRSAPLIAGGHVIQGVTASFASLGGFLVGLDLETGEEKWRFNTIARPGTPGGDSWNDVPMEKRSGGSVWHQGTYDPELDLVYYGVAPTYDTGPLLHPVDKEGVTNDALYTNCTIALDPKTGELRWYYQHMPNDQWDLDWVFERQIATIPFRGEQRRVVMNVGKMAILEALDAKTGEYLFSVDPGTQNVVSAIDPRTGKKTFDLERMPDPAKTTVVCPSAGGARSWPVTSLSPATNYVYIPITEYCMSLGPRGARLLTSGVGILPAAHPNAEKDGLMGKLQAIDVAYQEPAWSYDQLAPITTSTLSTAGGIVFHGDMEPSIKALDAKTGTLLWQQALDDLPTSNIITYSVADKQYVAVLVGVSNLHLGALMGPYAAHLKSVGKEPNRAPKGGPALWAFALP